MVETLQQLNLSRQVGREGGKEGWRGGRGDRERGEGEMAG